ncbi:hypothetical protein ACIRQY_35225 [Streptomyces sp. NPDC101490]|uniref:hypothetical protein n=1 Tax=Streptomyces sp. NPDC101490 TaxID=3366143 RepID=UPI003808CD13
MNRTVLAKRQRDDLVRLLNQWAVPRTLVSRYLRKAWEDTFPKLTGKASGA